VESESHRIHVCQADWTTLIAEIGHVDCDGRGLLVGLMVARRAIHGALLHGRLLVISDVSLPLPLASIFCDKGRGSTTIPAELYKIHAIVADFITCIRRLATLFAQTKFHPSTPGDNSNEQMHQVTRQMMKVPGHRFEIFHEIMGFFGRNPYHRYFTCQEKKRWRTIKNSIEFNETAGTLHEALFHSHARR
jgi:hypothetical protein